MQPTFRWTTDDHPLLPSASQRTLSHQAEETSFGISTAHASSRVQRWICPQARHRTGTRMSGRVSRMTISVERPVGIGRLVCGHLITMSLTTIFPRHFRISQVPMQKPGQQNNKFGAGSQWRRLANALDHRGIDAEQSGDLPSIGEVASVGLGSRVPAAMKAG